MKRTVLTAVLLAAFAMPAFAEDTIIKQDDSASMSKADTTSMSVKETGLSKTDVRDGDHGCMKRDASTLDMM